MAQVVLDHVDKVYPNGVHAVKDATLTVEDKEFTVLLGPSGCGKTTTLRMIAGLEEITKGTIKIDGKVVNDIEPKDRDIAMVFQNYALYPHMTVYQNMAFGLKLRKFPKDEIEKRVREAARILGIGELLDRKPKQLSGGQRQRVAVGRAKLHHRLGATIIYVTHDQIEAMTMADKIVIMRDGAIQQIGSPHEVYNEPANIFVAGFIGSPAMNFVNSTIVRGDGGLWIKASGFQVKVPKEFEDALADYIDKEVIFGIRPENIYDKFFARDAQPHNTVTGRVDVVEPLGSETLLHVTVGEDEIVAKVDPKTKAEVEQPIDLVFDMTTMHAFDKETQRAIR